MLLCGKLHFESSFSFKRQCKKGRELLKHPKGQYWPRFHCHRQLTDSGAAGHDTKVGGSGSHATRTLSGAIPIVSAGKLFRILLFRQR